MTPTSNGGSRPSARQLAYLRSLANRAGQTFAYPQTSAQASAEIRRLKAQEPSTQVERAIERLDDRAARESAEDAVAVRSFEIVGYGSNATWSQRV
jgi:hypothetical protein